MQVIIDGIDRTSDITRNSIKLDDELQQRINRAAFKIGNNNQPTEYDDIKVYESFEILAVDGTTITLGYPKELNDVTSIFRVDGVVVIDINESVEFAKTITAISQDSDGHIKMTVIEAGANGTVGKTAGVKEFAGNVIKIKDGNDKTLNNILYQIECLDYTRIFDKVLINDTFEDRDARYIVNSMCNEFINRNDVVDQMDYEDNTEIQAEWVETGDGNDPTVDTSDFREGFASGVFDWTFSGGVATFTASPSSQNVEALIGAASGAPTKGVMGFW